VPLDEVYLRQCFGTYRIHGTGFWQEAVNMIYSPVLQQIKELNAEYARKQR
jgi:hypothetical protein